MDHRRNFRSSRSLTLKLAALMSMFLLSYSIIRFCTRRQPATVKTRPSIEDRLSSIIFKAVDEALDGEIQRYEDVTLGTMEFEKHNLHHSRRSSNEQDLQCFLDRHAWDQRKLHYPSASLSHKPCTPSTYLKPVYHASQLCPLLAGRRVLFVGPETSYHLHMHWLRDLQLHENRSHTCQGPEFCNSHHICLSPTAETELRYEKGRLKKLPGSRELAKTKSASFRYALSTTLYAGGTPNDARYTSSLEQVDPLTGVRMRDSYWLKYAKKSDVLILNRGPLPAPSQTYDGTRSGNWTFLQDEMYSPRYMEKNWSKPGQMSIPSGLPRDKEDIKSRVVIAALHATSTRFLPSVLETFRILRRDRVIRDKTLLWHGSWYMQPLCLNPHERGIVHPEDALLGSLNNDYWLLYYNAQGTLRLDLEHRVMLIIHDSVISLYGKLPPPRTPASFRRFFHTTSSPVVSRR
ncbi:hypothetical protein L218DRAFT_994559 [Marasmius fiardii PR-910]|nr:hypothetical protein L218DRAFT_994559 [Marasmius fiardii PR-910]